MAQVEVEHVGRHNGQPVREEKPMQFMPRAIKQAGGDPRSAISQQALEDAQRKISIDPLPADVSA